MHIKEWLISVSALPQVVCVCESIQITYSVDRMEIYTKGDENWWVI